jgi:hypothetical protein
MGPGLIPFDLLSILGRNAMRERNAATRAGAPPEFRVSC